MSTSFRHDLARRLVRIAALAAPVAASSALIGCIPGGCDNPNPDINLCFDPQTVDAGFDRDAGSAVPGCPPFWAVPATTLLPASDMPQMDGYWVKSGPVAQGSQCCYVVQALTGCVGGRPFLMDDCAVVAPAQADAGGWSDEEAPLPHTGDLPAELRAELAEAWTRDGLFEHASIASFARFSLELLAVGAPADLVTQAHQAALDEVRHARLCLSLAGAYAGAPVGPGPLPLAGSVEVTSDLASVAARAAREGCIGETIAAVVAAEQLARAADPAVRHVLEIIAADEARHAELAWRTVAWAVRTGGAPVRAAVAAVLEDLAAVDPATPRRESPLDRHGRLGADEQGRTAARALVEVVQPAARALLAATRKDARLAA